MSDIFVQMSGDEANLLKAIRAVGQGAEKEIAGGFKKAQREAKQLERISTKALRSIETGQDRVNRETKEYKRALDAGKITQQQFTSAVKASERAHLQTGTTAGRQLKSTIAQYIGVQAVIGGVINLLKEEAAIRAAAGKRVQESRRGVSQLAQLTIDDDPEVSARRFAALKGKSEELFQAGGATDVNQAARTVFSLESAGLMGDFDIFKELGKGTVDSAEIETLSGAVATLSTAIGKSETGDAATIISKGFAASKFTQARVPDILQAIAQSGGIGKQLGLTDEQLITGGTALTKATGTAGAGGTQLNALLTALAKAPIEIARAKESVAAAEGRGETASAIDLAIAKLPDNFKGQSLQETAQIVERTIGKEGEAFFKLFGRKEAQGAIFNLTGEGEAAKLFPEIERAIDAANAGGGKIARTQAGIPFTDAGLRAAAGAETGRNRLQIAEERAYGQIANLRSEIFSQIRQESIGGGVSGFLTRADLSGRETVDTALFGDRVTAGEAVGRVSDPEKRAEFEQKLAQFDLAETNRLLAEQNRLLQANTRRQPAALTE